VGRAMQTPDRDRVTASVGSGIGASHPVRCDEAVTGPLARHRLSFWAACKGYSLGIKHILDGLV